MPHLSGSVCQLCPFEGSICLNVDHCSHRDDGADTCISFSSFDREKYLIGISGTGIQYVGIVLG